MKATLLACSLAILATPALAQTYRVIGNKFGGYTIISANGNVIKPIIVFVDSDPPKLTRIANGRSGTKFRADDCRNLAPVRAENDAPCTRE
jgi:hypothetical protein